MRSTYARKRGQKWKFKNAIHIYNNRKHDSSILEYTREHVCIHMINDKNTGVYINCN